MTAEQLIEHLKQLPPETRIVVNISSPYESTDYAYSYDTEKEVNGVSEPFHGVSSIFY